MNLAEPELIRRLIAVRDDLAAENERLRATIERVWRIARSDELGLRTYGISRDDIFAALAPGPLDKTGKPS